MSQTAKPFRPPKFPAPEFPPRRKPLFSTTPPAVFPVILGGIGLGLSLREAGAYLGRGQGLADLVLGLVTGLWLFAFLAMAVKILRRPGVLVEDLRPLPGRAGLAAATMGGMGLGAVLVPLAPGVALGLILVSLAAHLALGLLVMRVMARQGAEGLVPNPTWHLSFAGFVLAVPPLALLGWSGLAFGLTFLGLGTALVTWALSLRQILTEAPPAPLRPLLALHLAPAAVLSLGFGRLGWGLGQEILLALAILMALALVFATAWLLVSGVSPLWGALTFPLASLSLALWPIEPRAALVLVLAALGLVPWIGWQVLRLWPGDRLARRTQAAEA